MVHSLTFLAFLPRRSCRISAKSRTSNCLAPHLPLFFAWRASDMVDAGRHRCTMGDGHETLRPPKACKVAFVLTYLPGDGKSLVPGTLNFRTYAEQHCPHR